MAILPLASGATAWQARCNEYAGHPARSGSKREGTGTAGQTLSPSPLVAWICLLIVYVVWGSTYLAIRVGVETMPPLLMAAARSLVAGLIMFPLGLRRRRSAPLAPRWPSRAQWRACAAAGVLLLVGQGVVGVAERTIPSGLAALLIATVPLCGAVVLVVRRSPPAH
jgi:drug/metabolite transporter (DMT)-like permease